MAKKNAQVKMSEGLSSENQQTKNLQIINAGESVEQREPSYTVDGNVNWCSHNGEQYGDSLKN